MTPIAVASPAQKSATPAFALASFVAKPMASPGTHPCGAPAPASLTAASRRGTSPYGAAQEDDRRGLNLRRSLDPMMARLPCGISLQRDQPRPLRLLIPSDCNHQRGVRGMADGELPCGSALRYGQRW
jgi:hypothetical protein